MIQKIIGRKAEQELLHECYESNKPEFVAVYGRRRIGKTFLVKQFFKESLISILQELIKPRRKTNFSISR